MSFTCISESERRLIASSIYSSPLKPWETRVLRLEPVNSEHGEAEIVEVHLETAVIPHLEGLGLVDTGEVVFYEALSYTWDSDVFSHAIRCNGLDFSVTANLHAALVHLRSSHVHRWLWIDALCINQYDVAEKERQVRNMFHIYRKASTVLVWLGPAGPNTTLGADIVNFYDNMWQKWRHRPFTWAVEGILLERTWNDSNTNKYVEQFLTDLQNTRPADDGRCDADTLGLLSMSLDGISDILGRAWLRRTWIIQEFAAASRVEFQCGPSVLSCDAFFDVIPAVVRTIWSTRNVFLEEEEETIYMERLNRRSPCPKFFVLPGPAGEADGPACLRESSHFTEVLHQLRLLVNDPARNDIKSRPTQVEILLVLLVETVSQGFEVSIPADRLYSLMAMAESISCATLGLTYNKRTNNSPQRLPVDYSVHLRDAVLRTLKIRMNEIGYFYVAVQKAYLLRKRSIEIETDQETKSALFCLLTLDSSTPSWLRLLEFDQDHLWQYEESVDIKRNEWNEGQPDVHAWRYQYPYWVEQSITESDTVVVRGKALGRLVVDFKEHPSRIWVELPCPLGQEFETGRDDQKPVRALHQGCPDEQPATTDEVSLDGTEKRGGLGIWSWQFPPNARDGDVIMVFSGTCALIRPVPGGKYNVVEGNLRVPVRHTYFQGYFEKLEYTFLSKYCEDLDTFIFV